MNLLHAPWMKKKLEVIYNKSINGNLYIMYNDIKFLNYTPTTTSILINLLEDYNINIDINNKLYLYLPFNLNIFLKDLIINLKSLYENNLYIILCGYSEELNNVNQDNTLNNIYYKYPELKGLIDYLLVTDKSKCYEIFTALYDTQGIYISPDSSLTISCVTLNKLCDLEVSDYNHISFVEIIDNEDSNYYFNSYIKGLTNHNNNFNYYL